MGSGLSVVLSEPAAELYQRLIVVDGLSLADDPGLLVAPEAQELIRLGFARTQYVGEPPLLVAVEPVRAVEHAILADQRIMLDRYEALLKLRTDMHALQDAYRSAPRSEVTPSDLVRVLTDRQEIGALSVELALSAQHDVVSLETAHFTSPPDPRSVRALPATLVERGVRFRNVYARAVLDIPGSRDMLRSAVATGWQCRIAPALPMKLVVVDERAALLPLGPTGMEGAVLVLAPVVVAALRDYFELVWSAAQPVDPATEELPAELRELLALVMTGMTDAAIARHLSISERTVRRHVGALMKHFGATNRITLAVAVTRREQTH